MANALADRLEALGRSSVPEIDPTFVDELEWVLRVQVPDPTPRIGWQRPLVVAGAAFAVVLAVLTFSVLAGGRGGELQTVQLTSAVGTTVELPDGTIVVGEAGLEVPDGSVIRTDETGSATVAGQTLGPNETVEVVGRTIRPVDRQPDVSLVPDRPAPSRTTVTTTTSRAPTTTVPEVRAPTSLSEVRPTLAPPTTTVRPPEVVPPPTLPPDTTQPQGDQTRPEENEGSR